MASNVNRLVCTFYMLISVMLSRICSINSAECVEYYTLFEERSCDSANSTEIKPALINHSSWNISKYDMLALNTSSYEYPPEDCFIELVCDHVEKTFCEMPVYHSAVEVTSTTELLMASTTESLVESTLGYVDTTTELQVMETTTIEEVIIEPECRQFFTYIEVKTCNEGNSTVLKPVAVELDTYLNSSISQYTLEDDPGCPFVAHEYQFARLMCEEFTTVCEPSNRTAQAHTTNSTQNTALIAIGALGAVGVASALTYYGVIKITEILQSGSYRLPG